MSNVIPKYARLIDLLLKKTRESKIPWSFESIRRTVKVWNGGVLLSITEEADENYEDSYSITLHNESGTILEAFSDETLSGVEVDFGEDNYYVRIKNLFELAMRQSTGADRALDDFITAVEHDKLDIPF